MDSTFYNIKLYLKKKNRYYYNFKMSELVVLPSAIKILIGGDAVNFFLSFFFFETNTLFLICGTYIYNNKNI